MGTITWEKPELRGDIPSPRSGHTLTTSASTQFAFLFGGVSLIEQQDGATTTRRDDDLLPSDDEDEDGATTIRRRRRAPTARPNNETFRLDLCSGNELYCSKIDTAAGASPPPRWRHTANLLENCNGIVIFGGESSVDGIPCRLNDAWVFDVESESWSIPRPTNRCVRRGAFPCSFLCATYQTA